MRQIVLSLLIVGLVPGVLAIAEDVAFRPSSGMLSSMTLAESRAVQANTRRRTLWACRESSGCDERIFRFEPNGPRFVLDARASKEVGRSGAAAVDLGFIPSEVETPNYALSPELFVQPAEIFAATGRGGCD